MEVVRKPFQGVGNIIRFNWHYYVLSAIAIIALLLTRDYLPAALRAAVIVCILLIILANLVSLLVSYFIYDLSSLYKFNWLDNVRIGSKIININAGFDETSTLLKTKYADAELTVLDFYNPTKHTEVSIKRARKAYSPFPNTLRTSTTHLPLQDKSADNVFTIFSAHEIRNNEERVAFFKELNRVLAPEGQVIVTEHLLDTANFIAYNIGFLHFHSKWTWLQTFNKAGFKVFNEIKITPFISTFILTKNGTAS
ncbi:class I SAM-dependent methyltransferase [Flavihumibacter stibioxidans]|uniref:Methyltransferase n=1 Tax=Flavihumibacter stibioxidans TaxID=1834163 RepID=A0ABR7MAQ1_9BACT|nr:methyltransferase domain-containing protein [Flavihumibacter stibioxidans]MBC6491800.1 methyltransferase [Flavihumibacter stibioxidans]